MIKASLQWLYESVFLNESFDPEELDKIPLEIDVGNHIAYFRGLRSFMEQQPDALDLGEGSSRVVYLVDFDKVIKVARNQNGLVQNETEVNVITHPRTARLLFADIYDYSTKDYRWILSEYARPLEDDEEFEKLAGFPLSLVVSFAGWGYEEGITAFMEQIEDMLDNPNIVVNFLVSLAATIKATGLVVAAELGTLKQWGVTKDNRVVIVDYGLDNETGKKLFGWKKHVR